LFACFFLLLFLNFCSFPVACMVACIAACLY
jgi:hypothetical protein